MSENQLKVFSDKAFYILLVDVGDFELNKFDWNDPNYVQVLVNQPFLSVHQCTNETFFEVLKNKLNLNEGSLLVTQNIGEGPLHNYELLYLDSSYKDNNLPINQFATLLNSNGEVVKGPAVVVKNYIPTLTNDRRFEDMTTSELYNLLHQRGNNKVVTWNDESEQWNEEEVYGDMNKYAEKFFGGEFYHKCEIAFLKHNLNIWYLKSEYGMDNVMGTLLNCKVEKVLVFTMITQDIRGNITKDEVKKISQLSKVLTPPFKPDSSWFDEEKDEFNRQIIKNKYRVLDTVYRDSITNS